MSTEVGQQGYNQVTDNNGGAATSYTFTGPTTGVVGVPNTYILTPNGTTAATVTPSDSSVGGVFSPTSVTLNNTTPVSFTYTPGSVGTKTLSVTNNGGLTNPSNITLVVSAASSPSTPTGLAISTYPVSGLNGGQTSGVLQLPVPLQWSSSSGATGYRIYENGGSSPVYDGTNLFYDAYLAAGSGNSTFTVSAYNTHGESAHSSPVTANAGGSGGGGIAPGLKRLLNKRQKVLLLPNGTVLGID